MKYRTNSNNKRAVIMAFTNEDIGTIKWMYEARVTLGAYMLWVKTPESLIDTDVAPFIKHYPDVKGILFIKL